MIGAQAAAGLADYMQGTQAANAMEDYQKRLHQRNTEIANRDANRQLAALGTRMIQEQAAATQAIDEVGRQAERAAATTRLAAGEAGVSGGSLEAVLQDFKAQELRAQTTTIRNLAFSQAQFAAEGEGVVLQQEGKILSSLPQPVEKPNFLNTVLKIGAQSAGTLYGNFYDFDTGSWNFGSSGTGLNYQSTPGLKGP